jgi:hypothetical protein
VRALQTRYLGPTTHRGARIKAWAEGVGSLSQPRDYDQDIDAAHRAAARALADRHGWEWALLSGVLPNGDHCHVFMGDE